MHENLKKLLQPERLFSIREILDNPSHVPARKGLYAWYFKQSPQQIPSHYLNACHKHNGMKLLYVGIAPKGPQYEKTNLHTRIIRCHLKGTTQNSTLRLTLSALQGFSLQGEGKKVLNDWLGKNAFLCWMENDTPWLLEEQILRSYSCPLNIRGNKNHVFITDLKAIRRKARIGN